MKNYEKPVVLANNEMSEGVYAASGDCYTCSATVNQAPELGQDCYVVRVKLIHNAADGHHSNTRRVTIKFLQNVTFKQAGTCTLYSGDGTPSLTVETVHHNNASETIELVDLYIESSVVPTVEDVYCIYCGRDCNYGHSY